MPPICIYTEVVQAAGNTNYLSWVSAINQAFFNSLLSVRFCLSFNPSIWKFSKDWLISFFLKLSMMLGAHVLLSVTEPDFLKKNMFAQKIGKMGQQCASNRIFIKFGGIYSLFFSEFTQ